MFQRSRMCECPKQKIHPRRRRQRSSRDCSITPLDLCPGIHSTPPKGSPSNTLATTPAYPSPAVRARPTPETLRGASPTVTMPRADGRERLPRSALPEAGKFPQLDTDGPHPPCKHPPSDRNPQCQPNFVHRPKGSWRRKMPAWEKDQALLKLPRSPRNRPLPRRRRSRLRRGE